VRRQAYWLFELLAWPAAAWGAFECVARVAVGEHHGLGSAAGLTLMAGATIAACRWRQGGLALRRREETT
jgi:hypothetical protein